MNRRDFFKGMAAAAVVAKVGFYAVADKIVPPTYAQPIVNAPGAAAYGVDQLDDGWYRVWASWDEHCSSVRLKSILNRDKNTYPIPVVQFAKPVIEHNNVIAGGIEVQCGIEDSGGVMISNTQIEIINQPTNYYVCSEGIRTA